jgi:PadR family transcriptional regulator PadR
MEKAGYIEARWETLERGVPRKYYRLTKAGAKFLEARIAEWKEFTTAIERLMEKEKSQ